MIYFRYFVHWQYIFDISLAIRQLLLFWCALTIATSYFSLLWHFHILIWFFRMLLSLFRAAWFHRRFPCADFTRAADEAAMLAFSIRWPHDAGSRFMLSLLLAGLITPLASAPKRSRSRSHSSRFSVKMPAHVVCRRHAKARCLRYYYFHVG